MFPNMEPRVTALEGDELKEVTEAFQPIADLKPGDRVAYRKGFNTTRFPAVDKAITVHRILSVPEQSDGNIFKDDFTALFKDEEGDYHEFGFDSRRFKRVE